MYWLKILPVIGGIFLLKSEIIIHRISTIMVQAIIRIVDIPKKLDLILTRASTTTPKSLQKMMATAVMMQPLRFLNPYQLQASSIITSN
jgi:hypothetical protein